MASPGGRDPSPGGRYSRLGFDLTGEIDGQVAFRGRRDRLAVTYGESGRRRLGAVDVHREIDLLDAWGYGPLVEQSTVGRKQLDTPSGATGTAWNAYGQEALAPGAAAWLRDARTRSMEGRAATMQGSARCLQLRGRVPRRAQAGRTTPARGDPS
jgi:hypothetical protein